MSLPLTPRLVDTARGRVEVATVGADGPAVLVVHGTPGDWRQARTLATDLAAGHRLLLPARPGYGRTRLRVGRSPAEQAAGYLALLDALDVEQAVVVGISGGGPSSYAFAADHRDRCAGLVLCCAVAEHLMTPPVGMRALAAAPGLWAGLSGVARLTGRRRLADERAVLLEVGRGLSGVERHALDAGDARMRRDLLAFATDRVEALRGTGLRNDTIQFARAVRRPPRPWPAGPTIPVHVMHGSADSVVPVEHAAYHAAAIPGAVLEVLDGYGHALPITARDRLTRVVADVAVRGSAR